MTKNISTKLLKVQSNLKTIKKTGYNNHQKYSYATEQDINDVIRPELAKNNIAHVWSVENVELLKDGQFAIATVLHTFTDTDSGESVQIKSVGTGADKGDKAVYKAYTGASKYAFAKMFLIDTDDDPEKDTITAPSTSTNTSSKPTGGMLGGSKPAPKTSSFGSTINKTTIKPKTNTEKTKTSFGAKVSKKEEADEDIGF